MLFWVCQTMLVSSDIDMSLLSLRTPYFLTLIWINLSFGKLVCQILLKMLEM